MKSHSTLVSIAVYLVMNLTVLGAALALGVALAFKFLPIGLPRLRYLIALAAFCAASLVPILATLGSTQTAALHSIAEPIDAI